MWNFNTLNGSESKEKQRALFMFFLHQEENVLGHSGSRPGGDYLSPALYWKSFVILWSQWRICGAEGGKEVRWCDRLLVCVCVCAGAGGGI